MIRGGDLLDGPLDRRAPAAAPDPRAADGQILLPSEEAVLQRFAQLAALERKLVGLVASHGAAGPGARRIIEGAAAAGPARPASGGFIAQRCEADTFVELEGKAVDMSRPIAVHGEAPHGRGVASSTSLVPQPAPVL